MARLESLGCDPIEGLAKIAIDPETKLDLRVRCYAELAQYIYPKRKALDLSTGEDSSMTVVIRHIGADPP